MLPFSLAVHHVTSKQACHGFLLLVIWLYSATTLADIVKPALVEISVNTNGSYRVEVRARCSECTGCGTTERSP